MKKTVYYISKGSEIVFYSFFLCGHHFAQYRFLKLCIFCLFSWKTNFSSFCGFCFFLFVLRFEYTVLDIQTRSLKYTTVSRIREHCEQLFILIKAMQAITVIRWKQTTSKSFETCSILYTDIYSNCIVYQLFCCWKIT